MLKKSNIMRFKISLIIIVITLSGCVGNNLDFGYEYVTRNFQERRRMKIKKYSKNQLKMKKQQKIRK